MTSDDFDLEIGGQRIGRVSEVRMPEVSRNVQLGYGNNMGGMPIRMTRDVMEMYERITRTWVPMTIRDLVVGFNIMDCGGLGKPHDINPECVRFLIGVNPQALRLIVSRVEQLDVGMSNVIQSLRVDCDVRGSIEVTIDISNQPTHMDIEAKFQEHEEEITEPPKKKRDIEL